MGKRLDGLKPAECRGRRPGTSFPTFAEIEWNKRRLQEEDESEDQLDEPKTLPEQELEKIKSNLGRLILKEEKEKAVHFRRKTQSLPDRTHMHTSTALVLPLILFQDELVLSFCLLFPTQACQQALPSLLHTQAQAWPG